MWAMRVHGFWRGGASEVALKGGACSCLVAVEFKYHSSRISPFNALTVTSRPACRILACYASYQFIRGSNSGYFTCMIDYRSWIHDLSIWVALVASVKLISGRLLKASWLHEMNPQSNREASLNVTSVALNMGPKGYNRVISNAHGPNVPSLQAVIIIHNYTLRTKPVFHHTAVLRFHSQTPNVSSLFPIKGRVRSGISSSTRTRRRKCPEQAIR